MKINSKQRGDHTWDLTVHYHRCPSCGFISENRDRFTYRMGDYIKEVECPRCKHLFTLKKNIKPTVGPFFGEGTPCEMEWGDR